MKVTGIVAEYNPFHKGHAYHLAQAKKEAGADFVIVILSGPFVQRGECAITDKYTRAACALSQGADLVLELPVLYACASAEYFAAGAVRTLDRLGIVTHLAFGSETNDLQPMQSAARILASEPPEYKTYLKQGLAQGQPYPAARQHALSSVAPKLCKNMPFHQPNYILGLEYCKALYQCGSAITPLIIRRVGSGYHELEKDETFSSASSIRAQLYSDSKADLAGQLPDACIAILENAWRESGPLYADDLSSFLHFALLNTENMDYTRYADVSKELSNRIRSRIWEYTSFVSFARLLKTKELTYSRICRCLVHILLGITKSDLKQAEDIDYVPYVRVLGVKKTAVSLLGSIKRHADTALITNPADGLAALHGIRRRMLDLDCHAAHIQNSIVTAKYGQTVKNEFERRLLKW